jgi:hypothetical protein
MPTFEAPRPARADALEQALRAVVEPDEKLLWSGLPEQGGVLRVQDRVLIPFSLLWGGFAIAWEVMVFAGERDVPDRFDLWDKGFVLWGIPFVLAGLYFIVGRFFADAARRARTIYGVTDQRAILLTNFLGHSVRSIALPGLAEIALSKKPDGRGTITFGPANSMTDWARGWPGGSRAAPPAFEGTARADEVLKIIRDAQKRARA